jgi:E3 ubiquitin-protein ligase TRIP12
VLSDLEDLQLKFRTLGAICGRAILDQRVFDIRLSSVFWKVIMGKTCNSSDIIDINKNLSQTLSELQILANQYAMVQKVCDSKIELKNQMKNLTFNGVNIEDLCLVFTLPGFDEIEIAEGGADIEVNLDNLQDYIDRVTNFYLVKSISV